MADQHHPSTGVLLDHETLELDPFSTAQQLPILDGDLDNFVNELVQDPDNDRVVGSYDQFDFSVPSPENACNMGRNANDFPQNSVFGNPKQIPVWPVPPSPHACTCCQSLRELYHTNGTHVLKLDVHGRLGMISHAVLEKYNSVAPSQNHEYYMFDFSQESITNVKEFLVQYCKDRKREGYLMLQDPLSNFYDALCVGIDDDGSTQDSNILSQQSSRGMQDMYQDLGSNLEPDDNTNDIGSNKSFIATQRERTGKMKLRDLAPYFHLPIHDAAKEMNVCPSAIKSICRKEGLLRWPYRKIRSIESKILRKQQSVNSNIDADERERAVAEINELQQKLAGFYE